MIGNDHERSIKEKIERRKDEMFYFPNVRSGVDKKPYHDKIFMYQCDTCSLRQLQPSTGDETMFKHSPPVATGISVISLRTTSATIGIQGDVNGMAGMNAYIGDGGSAGVT
ncbi:hypothetical protein HYW58_00610 [Candidatus Kaiserbacteria bacterium]|nr:hypothetical protein [Candidatus Kaiserbacteria bacterium]